MKVANLTDKTVLIRSEWGKGIHIADPKIWDKRLILL